MATLSETNFALTFLQQLSARPIKYASDYIAPPSTLGAKPLMLLPPMEKPKRKRTAAKDEDAEVKVRFTSLKAPRIDVTLTAPPSQTFHALKTRLAEQANLNPLALRLLVKNKAVNDSKSVQEVFGQTEAAQVTVMVMKNVASTGSTSASTSSSSQVEGGKTTDSDAFWEGIRQVVMDRYKGAQDKEQVFATFQKAYGEAFGSA